MVISAAKLIVEIAADVNGLTRGLSQAEGRLAGFGNKLLRTGSALTAGLSLPTIAAGGALLQLGMSAEQSEIAFTTMLGSAEAARDFLEDLRDFAASTPFEFTELQDASRRLLAMGFAAEDVLPMLTDIGDAVSGLGLGADGVDRVTLALGQMQAKGKVSGEEMMQLLEAGIPGWRYLAESMGLTTAEVMDLSQRGLLPADTAIQAILKGMREDFGGMMADQSKTAAGELSNLKDELTSVGVELGRILLPATKEAIGTLRDMTTWFGNLDPAMQQSILSIGGLAIAAGPAMTVIGGLAKGAGALIGAVQGIAAGFAAWNAGMSLTTALGAAGIAPIAITLGAVALAAGAVVAVWAQWNDKIAATNEEGKKATAGVWEKFFGDLKANGADAIQTTDEFIAAYKRMNSEIAKGGVAGLFVDKQGLMQDALKELSASLGETAGDYETYRANMSRAIEEAGLFTEVVNGNLVVYQQLQSGALRDVTAELGFMSQAQYEHNQAIANGTLTLSEQEAAVRRSALALDESSLAMGTNASAAVVMADNYAQMRDYAADAAQAQADLATQMSNAQGIFGEYQAALQTVADAEKSWMDRTGSDLVRYLGDSVPKSSERYAQALGIIDEVMGTNALGTYEAEQAQKALMEAFAKTGNVDELRSGLEELKRNGLDTVRKGLEDAITKAKEMYDQLMALPKDIQTVVDFSASGPQWLLDMLASGAIVPPGGGNEETDNREAIGGPVYPGTPYLVGERGPEMFVPTGSGTIVPNKALSRRGGQIILNFNQGAFSGTDDLATRRNARIIAAELERIME